MKHILVVEDEKHLATGIKVNLEADLIAKYLPLRSAMS